MTIPVEVWVHRYMTGEEIRVTRAVFIYVAVDRNGKPIPVKRENLVWWRRRGLSAFDEVDCGDSDVVVLMAGASCRIAISGVRNLNFRCCFARTTLDLRM